MNDCEHEAFAVNATVIRLTTKDGGHVEGFTAEITVTCAKCGTPFKWLGLPMGASPTRPMASVDGYTLRAPLLAAGQGEPLRVPEFIINQRGVQ